MNPTMYINCMGDTTNCGTTSVNGVLITSCDSTSVTATHQTICETLGYVYDSGTNTVYDGQNENCPCDSPTSLSFTADNAAQTTPSDTTFGVSDTFCCGDGYVFSDGDDTESSAVYKRAADSGDLEHYRCVLVFITDEKTSDSEQKVPFYETSANNVNTRRVWEDTNGLTSIHDDGLLHGTCIEGSCPAPDSNVTSQFPNTLASTNANLLDSSFIWQDGETIEYPCGGETCGSITATVRSKYFVRRPEIWSFLRFLD